MALKIPKALGSAIGRLGLELRRVDAAAGPARPMASATSGPVVPPGQQPAFGDSTHGARTRPTGTLAEMRDAKPRARREAMANSRFLRAKLGVVKALYDSTARYSLGTGLLPKSYCEDEEWGKRADEMFLDWASRHTYDVREGMDFFRAQKVVFPDVQCDGDAGAVPVRDLDDEPRVQHFPSELIDDATGPSVFAPEGSSARWREGILRSAVGTPIAYRVLREPELGRYGVGLSGQRRYWDYPARNFWHVGRPDRLNANRPLPWLYYGDQAAVNILDLNTLEMQAAKLNSYFAAAIRKAEGGGMPAGFLELMERETETVPAGTDEEGNPQTREIERSYLNLFGGAGIPVLEPGEELQFFKNDRPSTTFAGFMEYLVADIATGYGIPWQFVWGLVGLAGPAARLVLQKADWFFTDSASVMVSHYCQPIWESYVGDRMNRGLLRAPRPGTNWRAVQWQGPGSLTIDKGRDGKLYLDLVKNGMGTRTAWFEMTGKNGAAEIRRVVREIREIMEICGAEGVPVEYVLGDQAARLARAGADAEEVAEALAEAARSA